MRDSPWKNHFGIIKRRGTRPFKPPVGVRISGNPRRADASRSFITPYLLFSAKSTLYHRARPRHAAGMHYALFRLVNHERNATT